MDQFNFAMLLLRPVFGLFVVATAAAVGVGGAALQLAVSYRPPAATTT